MDGITILLSRRISMPPLLTTTTTRYNSKRQSQGPRKRVDIQSLLSSSFLGSRFHSTHNWYSTTTTQLDHNGKTTTRNVNYHHCSDNDDDDDDDEHSNLYKRIVSTIPYNGQNVQVGQYAKLERSYSQDELDLFSRVVQDYNPLHSIAEFDNEDSGNTTNNLPAMEVHDLPGGLLDTTGRDLIVDESKVDGDGGISTASPGGGRCSIVHGMLVAGIFSSTFGCIAPGCVYLNQTLDFKKPVYVDDTVCGRIDIQRIRPWRKEGIVIQCATNVYIYHNHHYLHRGKIDEGSSSNNHISTFEEEGNDVAVSGTATVWLPAGSRSSIKR
mmetsp:Transcript_61186/g.149809  ORF Transcript_61186/g.149809 Transcript_61186/m.149809 type:complete len:326 (-) Transcript_61186:1023-2000(-)